jgi:hypothetical protein
VPFSDVIERSTSNFIQVFQQNVLPMYHAEITKIRNFNPLNTELNPICHLLAFAAAPYIYTTLVG